MFLIACAISLLTDVYYYICIITIAGTTWMQEILYQVHTEGDLETADEIILPVRVPFIELVLPDTNSFEDVCSQESPRLIKTHLSANFFEKTLTNNKTKFIVVVRNPKDILVSYYHFYRMNTCFGLYPGTWDDFYTLFKENRLVHGSPFDVMLSWWKLRADPRVLVLHYEYMLDDLEGAIVKVATHLGKDIAPDLVKKIAERTSFKSMKRNDSLNYMKVDVMKQEISPFMRKGELGDWVSHFSKEQSDYIDTLCEKYFAPEGLFFKFV